MHNQLYNDCCKAKNLKWGGMHWCFPLLKSRRKLVFLSFTNVDPQASTCLFLIHVVTNRAQRSTTQFQAEGKWQWVARPVVASSG
jgi:hypothetical protein